MLDEVCKKASLQFHSLTNAVSETYNIGDHINCELPPGGLLNHVYVLRTTQGKYVLKEHLYRNSESKLQSLKSLLDRLKSYNVSCDYIIPTGNCGFFFEFQGSMYTMHRFIEGTTYANLSQLNTKQRTNAIKFLVGYHRVVWGFNVQGENIKPSDLPVVFTDNVQWIRGYISDHQNIFERKEDYKFITAQTDKLEAYITSNRYQDLPRLLIHGDYRFCNVVFTDNQVGGLFDWDLLQHAPRVFEVVDACSNFALDLHGPEKNIDSMDKFADFKSLVLTYQREACKNDLALSAQEIAAIPEMFRMKSLQTGINFAILLRGLPLRPGETWDQRTDRSRRCLNDSLETLRNINGASGKAWT